MVHSMGILVSVILAIIIFIATFLGATSGLGGGVIIKPIFDSLGLFSISSINFYSAVSVFVMAIVSSIKVAQRKDKVLYSFTLYLVIGSIVGGIFGQNIFEICVDNFDANLIGNVQSIILGLVLTFTLIGINLNYKKNQVVKSKLGSIVIGLCLGLVSTFLGIGGGPINVFVLVYFFHFDIKMASVQSVVIILFSQLFSLSSGFITGSYANIDFTILIYLLPAAVIGGLVGAQVNRHISKLNLQRLFNIILVVIIGINIYNIF